MIFDFWCFSATFSNISAISWRPALVVEDVGVPGVNHRSWASNWKTVWLAAASLVHHFFVIYKAGANPRRIGDMFVSVVRYSNYLTHWSTRVPWIRIGRDSTMNSEHNHMHSRSCLVKQLSWIIKVLLKSCFQYPLFQRFKVIYRRRNWILKKTLSIQEYCVYMYSM